MDLGVRQPEVIIDGRMNVVESDPSSLVRGGVAGRSAVRTPAAIGNSAQLLHIHVHQLAWSGAFVAAGGGLQHADDGSGEWVALD